LILGLRGCGWWRGGRGEKKEEEREGFLFAGEVVLFCLCRFCMSPSWPVKKILSGVNLHLEALLFSLGAFLF
jgi:hypothetical protein